MAAESPKMSSTAPQGLCPSGIFQAKKADLVEENAERGLAVDGKSDPELRLDRCMYEMELQEDRRDLARKKLVPLMKETKGQLSQYLKTLGSGAEFDDEVNLLGMQKYKPPVLASILRQFKGATASEFEKFPAYESSKGGRKESSQSSSDTGGGEGSGGGKGSSGSGAERVMYELADKVDKYWAGLKSDERLAMVRKYYANQGIQLAEDLALDDADDMWASLDPQEKVNVFMPTLLPTQTQKTSGKGKKREQEKDAKKKNKKQARPGEGKGKGEGRKDRSLSSVSESLHRNSPLDDEALDPEEMIERARRAQATLEEQAPRPGTKRPSSRAVARTRLASVSKYLDAAEEERLLVSHDVDRLVVGAAKRYRAAQLSSIAKEEEEEDDDEEEEEEEDDDDDEEDDDIEDQIQNMEEARTALRSIAEDLSESIIEALGIYADAVLVLRNV